MFTKVRSTPAPDPAYYALRKAVDVALDQADLPTARQLLEELDEHAVALDADTGTTGHASAT